jgi:predicted transcriptional regulator
MTMNTKKSRSVASFLPEPVLHVSVGESLLQASERVAKTMKALEAGRPVDAHFGDGFSQIGQMLAVFTPKRWELIAALREAGPLSVAELARLLGRNYKNVQSDVAQLVEWMTVERGDDGRVGVPWSEIVLDMKLPQRLTA